jgi:hypothetical protein
MSPSRQEPTQGLRRPRRAPRAESLVLNLAYSGSGNIFKTLDVSHHLRVEGLPIPIYSDACLSRVRELIRAVYQFGELLQPPNDWLYSSILPKDLLRVNETIPNVPRQEA